MGLRPSKETPLPPVLVQISSAGTGWSENCVLLPFRPQGRRGEDNWMGAEFRWGEPAASDRCRTGA